VALVVLVCFSAAGKIAKVLGNTGINIMTRLMGLILAALAVELLASGLTVAFLVAGLSAWRRLRGDASAEVQATLRTGLVLGAVLIPLQILAGDLHGLNTLEHQPAKVAAMEGIWETERGAGLRLFALPDEENRTNHYEIQIPKLASLILTHELDGEVKGLNEFEHHPPVAPVFWSFRVMVGIGMLMLAVSWLGVWQLKRRGEPARWLQRVLVGMTFAGWVATLAGWYVTEIGRQPFVVYGLLLVTYVGVLKYMAENPKQHAPESPTGAVLGKAGV
jgi:cytochrome d ubiquinol oxidase subunit I